MGGCDLSAAPGLRISVIDSQLDTPLPGTEGARAIAREGAFADTVAVLSSDVFLVYERAGTYEVQVEYPGYGLWTRSNVLVERGRCHVRLTALTARLATSCAGCAASSADVPAR
jgi:hypothetical protein